ncbi:hypothetical protein HTZ84_12390 [Haloterrigena sp. SYSU A558-1]|uniref:Pilin/flagellin n=1 Tax=Haloterrigena gelatinilytica TaxID=2741724 RepID=A0ABX2LGX3_9EURY|nr:hypothetical protein [Haloterrigena gelatinilytica]NUC73101.1 hypothetical protein [Haloterrigena gelatinilytica]
MSRTRTRTDRDRRPKTVSISLRERGQTTQDFAIGIGVFILAVAFVFSFLPSILTPFDSSVSGGQTAQADRVADRAVHDLSTESGPETELERFFDEDDDLSERLGLREDETRYDRIDVRLEPLNESEPLGDDWTVGDGYDNQSAASSARIVTFADGTGPTDGCEPACRLVVRVW